MDSQTEKAVEVFRKGGIVIFPTDTALGIGCRIDSEGAVKRLFEIRRRPLSKAVPVLFSDMDMVRKYVGKIPQDAEKLINKFWPGALTLIFRCNKGKVPDLVRGGGCTLGIRIPDHKAVREIIAKLGVPILGSSANFSGEKTPFEFKELDPSLAQLADYVLDTETGLSRQDVSTIVDCTAAPWRIIREGAIKI